MALAFWVYRASSYADAGAFAFWREKSDLILVFWLSVLADMFVFYRLSEEERKQHKIKPLTYEEKGLNVNFPNNWEELRNSSSKYRVDVADGFDQEALEAVERSFILADKLSHEFVTPVHLFVSILSNIQVAAIFSRLDVDSRKLVEKIKEQLEKIPVSENKTVFSKTIRSVLVDAYIEAESLEQKKVTAKNFIIPIIRSNEVLREVLYDLEIDEEKIFNVLTWFIVNDKLIENHRLYRKSAAYKPSSNMDRAYTSVATPALNQIAYDLTVAAKWGRLEYCVSRNEEIEKIFQNFESGGRGVILVGLSGVGKSTIVDGLAQMMVREDVPKIFKDKRLVELDAARLISGSTPAQAEGKLMA